MEKNPTSKRGKRELPGQTGTVFQDAGCPAMLNVSYWNWGDPSCLRRKGNSRAERRQGEEGGASLLQCPAVPHLREPPLPCFLTHSCSNPWTLRIDNCPSFCMLTRSLPHSLRMGAGGQGNQPGEERVGTFTTPPSTPASGRKEGQRV